MEPITKSLFPLITLLVGGLKMKTKNLIVGLTYGFTAICFILAVILIIFDFVIPPIALIFIGIIFLASVLEDIDLDES